MRKFVLALCVLAVAVPALAQLRVLVIDQSQTLQESLRLLYLVRALKAKGFVFQAITAFPTTPVSGEPFSFVLVIPPQGPYIWFCPPGPEDLLPKGLKEPALALKTAASQIFAPIREVRGPSQDLYPLLLSLYFGRLGFFGEPEP